MRILARNFRCPAGEADIIALDRSTRRRTGAETIAFVEVKTRSSDKYTEPFSAVDAGKRGRLRKVAQYYLRVRNAGQYNARFDVVSIVLRDGEKPQVHYIPEAF
jgi:putative endonuclease